MFLKRLDVVGFKSFAERISVEFVNGVTAVVGPNGSGKSNITDAIRWVLGEQSAKSLRGAKMEDIIFAGSDTRKPLNFAEVTLTLDNEDHFLPIDYNEVSVTRRVYRSGESEFYINKQSCRLKDIIDLFMDSGLGREAFSIISQGKVEEILNSKAEDRRSIFEEAAGVLKYKSRKKKAESKLFETQDNLNRVNDILHELESQIEPLKIQSSLAKEFLEKKEELEQFEVALIVHDIEELHKKWNQLQTNIVSQKDRELELFTSIQKKEEEQEVLKNHIVQMDQLISNLQSVLLQTSEELEKLEGRKEVLKERKKNAAQNEEQLKKNIAEVKEKLAKLTEERNKYSVEFNKLEQEKKDLSNLLKEKEQQLQLYSENVEEKIETLKSDYIELLNSKASANNERNYIEQQLQQQEAKMLRLDKENEKFLEERKQVLKNKEEISHSLQLVRNEIENLVAVYRNEQRELENLNNQYKKAESNLYQAYQYVQQAKSRKELLEEMEDDYAGFFQGVKEILKARSQLQGIEGAVAELIQVRKEYEVAIDISLGSAMQHIVVENEEYAREAIQFLKKHSYGRATFLPKTVIKSREMSPSTLQTVQSHPSFIGLAVHLIDYDKKYENIFSNLLGHVIVAKDLKGANEIAKQLQHRYRVVTLDGDVVNPGGSMTGGASKQKTSTLLSRKTELEQLKTQLVSMEEKTEKLEIKVKKLKQQVQEQEEKLQSVQQNGELLREQEQTIKDQLKDIEWEEKNVNDRLSLYDDEKKSFDQERSQLNSRRVELEKQLEEFERKISDMDREISKLSEKKFADQSVKETLTEEMNEIKISLAAKVEQVHHFRNQVNQMTEDILEYENRLALYEEDLQLLQSEISESQSGEHQLEVEAKQKSIEKNETIQSISENREKRLTLQQQLDDIEHELKELKRLHKGLSDSLKDEEVKLNRIDVELENKLAHLREEYMISFEAAKEQYTLSIPQEEARKKVKLIKKTIEELGTVNLGAIDEYERVSERYQFLTEQKNDLQHAKDNLFQVIDEMDEEMKRRFEETFYAIGSHFESVFQSLFGGGRAELKLTDPTDLLNTGVEIVAQPPGKKLQNLGLLSGGERALTAIALLFSILKVRPVPFCVLDEVEAALDEANVARFSQYLKAFSKETQFIVITHRKGTMEGADVLYGITMQESGVSKLVSVRLEEKEAVQLV